jgi:hypothetical protein
VEDFEQDRCVLHHAQHGGGGLMRSIKTEGAAVRRIDLLCAQTLGAFLREALVVPEAESEAAEALPAFLWRAA